MSDTRGNDALQQGIAAARAGDKQRAYILLGKGLQQDRNHVEGWLWLARIADDPTFRRRCVNVVLRLDPQNLEAQFIKSELEDLPTQPVRINVPSTSKAESSISVTPVSKKDAALTKLPKGTRQPKRQFPWLFVFLGAAVLSLLFLSVSLFVSYHLGWWGNQILTAQPSPIAAVPVVGTSNLSVEYILDASGSMNELLPDGVRKADAAKERLTLSLKTYRPEASVGLRVYGHRVSLDQQAESCQNIELVAPVAPGYQGKMINWLENYQAFGMTPIHSALQYAVGDFPTDSQRLNSVVLISDGMETCGGDPCEFVRQMQSQGIRFVLHVIGLNVDDPTREQLICIAQAGGGLYQDANSSQALQNALEQVQAQVVQDSQVILPEVPVAVEDGSCTKIGQTQISIKDGMDQVCVPEGEFQMGSEIGEDNQKPVHSVWLDAFWIDRTEVTSAMYQKCVQDGVCSELSSVFEYYGNDYYSKYADHPVIYNDWDQAKTYCEWAGKRLPSEAEWEKAARGTDGRMYPWGNDNPSCSLENFNHGEPALSPYHGCAGTTNVVGSYPLGASPYGALDMAGNVWEWVNDWYGDQYYSVSPYRNPPGPSFGDVHILRGGSWYNFAKVTSASLRAWFAPTFPMMGIGFRCASSTISSKPVNVPAILTYTTRNFSESGAGYRFDIDYPYFSGSAEQADFLNQAISKAIFESQMANDFRKGEMPNSDLPSFIESREFQVIYLDSHIASLWITLDWYGSGAAHPNQETNYFNFDLDRKTEIFIADIFQDMALHGANWTSTPNRLVQYCTQNAPIIGTPDGRNTWDVDDFREYDLEEKYQYGEKKPPNIIQPLFNLQKDGILFQEGSYWERMVGVQTCNVPYAVIGDLLKPDAPLPLH